MTKRFTTTIILLLITPVLVIGFVLSILFYLWFCFTNQGKAWKIALGLDDLDNVAFNGRLGQSISSRAANANQQGRLWGCILCQYFLNILDPGPPNHCTKALTDPNQNLEENKAGTAAG